MASPLVHLSNSSYEKFHTGRDISVRVHKVHVDIAPLASPYLVECSSEASVEETYHRGNSSSRMSLASRRKSTKGHASHVEAGCKSIHPVEGSGISNAFSTMW